MNKRASDGFSIGVQTLSQTRSDLYGLLKPEVLGDTNSLGVQHLRRIFGEVTSMTGFGLGLFNGRKPESKETNGRDAMVRHGSMQMDSRRDARADLTGRMSVDLCCGLDDTEFVTRLLHLVVFSSNAPESHLLDRFSVQKVCDGTDPQSVHLLLEKLVEVATSSESVRRWGKYHINLNAPNLYKTWFERFSNLPVADSHTAVLHGHDAVKKLAPLAAQLEVLSEELMNGTRSAGLDPMELCRLIKAEVFNSEAFLQDPSATRAAASYANKHITGNPSLIYDVGTQIGAGSFGCVYKGVNRKTKQTHALKYIPKSKVHSAEIQAELDIMKQLDHPHIMRLYNTFEDDFFLYMATEFCAGGAFFDTLCQAGSLEEKLAFKLFRQIIGVVSYMHSRCIAHRDIKPENFLVLRQADITHLHLKLIDFGTAKRFDVTKMVTKVCTPNYVAPEVLNPKLDPYTEKVDIWSCGVMLFVMLCGHLPFNGATELAVLKKVRKAKYDFEPAPIWSTISENAKDLLREIFLLSVHDRCSAEKAYNHEWCYANLRRSSTNNEGVITRGMVSQILNFLTDNRLKRVSLRIIARQMDDDAIEFQRRVWLSADTDNSGTLTLDELNQAVMQIEMDDKHEMSRDGMVKIMCQLDPTGYGCVEFTEFVAATLQKSQYTQEDVCRAAFVRLDFDGDGIVSRKDLGRLLSDKDGLRDAGLTGATLSELMEEVEKIMSDVDFNNDGGISFQEFMELMNVDGTLPTTTASFQRTKRPNHANYAKDLATLWSSELADDSASECESESSFGSDKD